MAGKYKGKTLWGAVNGLKVKETTEEKYNALSEAEKQRKDVLYIFKKAFQFMSSQIGYKNNKSVKDVLDANFDYSLEEKVVGTWFGKPLYRKGFEFTTGSASTSYTTDLISTNIDHIHISEKSSASTSTQIVAANSYHTTSSYATGMLLERGTNISILIRNGSSRSALRYIVFLEYTKTTD